MPSRQFKMPPTPPPTESPGRRKAGAETGLLQWKAARPSLRECPVACCLRGQQHGTGTALCGRPGWAGEAGRTGPCMSRKVGKISSGETRQQRPPESGQSVGSGQTLKSEQTDLQERNSTKARTFKTLPKAGLKDVQREAAGTFSWIRIWSFSSLEGTQGPETRASVSSDPPHRLPIPGAKRKAFLPCSSPRPQGDTGERRAAVWPPRGIPAAARGLPARAVAPGLTEAARGKAGECRQWGLLLAGGSLQREGCAPLRERSAPRYERQQH